MITSSILPFLKLSEQLIEFNNGPAYLKEFNTGKFIFSNQESFLLFNLCEDTFIGKTILNLSDAEVPYWKTHAAQEQALDNSVNDGKKPIKSPFYFWLNTEGHVFSHRMKKFPVLDLSGKMVAIMTFGENLTDYLSLWDLYQHYCTFYEDKIQRVSKFLEHTQIKQYFLEPPTHCEVLVLILKELLYTNSAIAKKINVKLSTIETHINKLNQKTIEFQCVMHQMAQWRSKQLTC